MNTFAREGSERTVIDPVLAGRAFGAGFGVTGSATASADGWDTCGAAPGVLSVVTGTGSGVSGIWVTGTGAGAGATTFAAAGTVDAERLPSQ